MPDREMFAPQFNSLLPRRLALVWVAGRRGKPGLNADIQNSAESTRMVTDPDMEVLGTNATSGSTAFNPEGGITLTTGTSSNDQVIILPHLDTNQSAWTQWTWGNDQQTDWECHIKTPSTITSMTIWAGLKLTNTSVTATDADQAFFRYDAATNSGKWQAISSINNSDDEADTGLTVAASTEYHLRVAFDQRQVARFWVNGLLVETSAQWLTAGSLRVIDFIPYIGVQTTTTAARTLGVYSAGISRTF